MQDDVDNLILVADVFRRRGHDLVDNFAEKVYVTLSVVGDARHQFGCRAFMLVRRFSCEKCARKNIKAYRRYVLKIYRKHLLFTVGYLLLHPKFQRAKSLKIVKHTSCSLYLRYLPPGWWSSPSSMSANSSITSFCPMNVVRKSRIFPVHKYEKCVEEYIDDYMPLSSA